jgi:hypothetical protein
MHTRRRPSPSARWTTMRVGHARRCRWTSGSPGAFRPSPMSSTTTTRWRATSRRSVWRRTGPSSRTSSTCRTRRSRNRSTPTRRLSRPACERRPLVRSRALAIVRPRARAVARAPAATGRDGVCFETPLLVLGRRVMTRRRCTPSRRARRQTSYQLRLITWVILCGAPHSRAPHSKENLGGGEATPEPPP